MSVDLLAALLAAADDDDRAWLRSVAAAQGARPQTVQHEQPQPAHPADNEEARRWLRAVRQRQIGDRE